MKGSPSRREDARYSGMDVLYVEIKRTCGPSSRSSSQDVD
jgi:hypothetical protein